MTTNKIPPELQRHNQFVCWKMEQRKGQFTKIPYSAETGQPAKSNDPATWRSYDRAIAAMQNGKGYNGIGFMLSESDLFVGVDLDHCIVNEKTEDWAKHIIDVLNSYSEISPSGDGIHIFVKARMPERHRCKKKPLPKKFGSKQGEFEIYNRERYLTLTGKHIPGTPLEVEDRQLQIEKIYEEVFGEKLYDDNNSNHQNTTQDRNGQGFQGDDDELLEKARKARNGQKFVSLFDDGDTSGHGGDDSAADQALCNMLAFWCGKDPEKIDRLFRKSALCRDKWLDREDYRQRTINKALQSCKEAYGKKAYNFTDAGNAERFAYLHGDKVRHNHTSGKSMYYDGKVWNTQKAEAEIMRLAITTARSIFDYAQTIADTDKRKVAANFSFNSENSARLKAMISIAMTLPPIAASIEDFDQGQMLLNVQNGTIDLRTGELRPHSPDDMITQIAATHYPETESEEKIGLWLDCINTWHNGNEDTIGYLQRLGGYCLTGSTASRVFPIFYGGGKNGKSVFLDTTVDLIGDYGTIAPRTLLKTSQNDEHPSDISSLVGKRIVLASESNKDMKLKTALVKAMTGDAMMKARFLYHEPFDFKPTHKVILVTQNLPIIDEASDAIWDRVHKLEWGVRIEESKQNPNLLEELKKEWPGILKWLVQGCLKWQADGCVLTPTEGIKRQTAEYRDSMNPIKDFINDMCVIGEDLFIAVPELRGYFNKYVNISGLENTLSAREFNSLMRVSGYREGSKRVHGKVLKCWQGISLANDTVDEDDIPI